MNFFIKECREHSAPTEDELRAARSFRPAPNPEPMERCQFCGAPTQLRFLDADGLCPSCVEGMIEEEP